MSHGFHNTLKTACPHGHPYDETNTYVSKRGSRSCRACSRQRSKAIDTATRVARTMRWQARNPDKVKAYDKRRRHKKTVSKYGITPERYAALMQEQGGACAICRQTCAMGRRLSVDHDHATGAVRGLLCGGCNVAIGRFGDDVIRLKAAIAYLEFHAVGPLS